MPVVTSVTACRSPHFISFISFAYQIYKLETLESSVSKTPAKMMEDKNAVQEEPAEAWLPQRDPSDPAWAKPARTYAEISASLKDPAASNARKKKKRRKSKKGVHQCVPPSVKRSQGKLQQA